MPTETTTNSNMELTRLALHAARIESDYKTDEAERLRAISWAYIDVIDYALDTGVIEYPDQDLPDYINEILVPVCTYLKGSS